MYITFYNYLVLENGYLLLQHITYYSVIHMVNIHYYVLLCNYYINKK
jgi:hypothetical protein